MNRRDFIKTAALAAGSGLALPSLAQKEGSKACLHFFSKPLQSLGYDALAETLAQVGLGGIDLSVGSVSAVAGAVFGWCVADRGVPVAAAAGRSR